MNQDIFEGKWKQLRGRVKEWWGKVTDDDLERVDGKYDQFVGMLQEKYGYTREQVEEEVERRTKEYEADQQEQEVHQRVVDRELQQKDADIALRVAQHSAAPHL